MRSAERYEDDSEDEDFPWSYDVHRPMVFPVPDVDGRNSPDVQDDNNAPEVFHVADSLSPRSRHSVDSDSLAEVSHESSSASSRSRLIVDSESSGSDRSVAGDGSICCV